MSKFVVHSSSGWVRVVEAESVWDALYRVGSADATAQTTALPAFREMIDTLRWEDMR